MEEIEMAISLLPYLQVLYKLDVLDVQPGGKPYIQITEEKFKKLFPEMKPGADGYYRFNYNGIMVLAVYHE